MLGCSTGLVYMMFPSYLRHLRSLAECHDEMDVVVDYWPGFAGGGVLSRRSDLPDDRWDDLQCQFSPSAGVKYPYGTSLGNPTAKRLAECVHVVQTDEWVPDLLIQMGFAKKPVEPQVKMTVEHLDGLGDQIYLLIVPKRRSKLVPRLEQLKHWFSSFHVQVSDVHEVDETLRSAVSEWFDDPKRCMYTAVLSGGEPEAAWYLAALVYVSEYWDLMEKGLDSIHVVAEISGKPNFRKHWTSNR